jgi:hypothetical protein
VNRIAAWLLLSTTICLAQTPSIVPTFRPDSLKPFVIDMVGALTPDNGGPAPPSVRFHDTLTETTWRGHKAMRRETATTLPGGTEFFRWATVIFDAKTLLPYYSEYRRSDGLFLRREFDGLHVKETRTVTDVLKSPPLNPAERREIVTSDFVLPEPAFTWIENTGLPILLALALREGLEGSVPVISGDKSLMKPCTAGPCFILRMSYHVSGPETITGMSGKLVRTWKICVPETQFFFWIACDRPQLEQVTWPGPGGRYSMQASKP